MPISSLPEELFVQIINHNIQQFDPAYWAQLQEIRLVCKRWNEIIEGTPSLWALISSHMNRIRIQESLHFSGSHDLTVSAFVGNEEFWERILPHASRWADLVINGVQHEESMEKVRSTSVPRLTSLTLAWCDDGVVDAFSGKLLSLKHLMLHRAPCPWSPADFQSASLKSLRLIEHPFRSSHDTFQMFEILRSCTELVTFHLSASRTPPSLPQSLVPVSLPHLTELSLQDMKNDFLHLILQTLHVPNCRSVAIRGEAEEGFAGVGHAVLSKGWGQVRERGRISISMAGVIVDCELVNERAGEPVRLQLDFRVTGTDSTALDCIEAFGREFRDCIGLNVSWDLSVLDVAYPSWLARILPSCARLFPTTHMLRLINTRISEPTDTKSNTHDPLECLHSNSSPNQEGDGNDCVGLAFPRLLYLRIEYHKTHAEGVVQVAHRRILNAGGGGMPKPALQMEIIIRDDALPVPENVLALSQLTPQVTITRL